MSRDPVRLEKAISWILIVGVLASLAFESFGLILNFLQSGDLSISFTPAWHANSRDFFSFVYSTATSTLAVPTAINLVSLGVILLMLTPYVRVAVSVAYFGFIKDARYFGITLLVLAIITASLLAL